MSAADMGTGASCTTAVVTGATSGIGLEVSRVLAKKGFRLICVGRSAARCAEAEADLRSVAPDARVEYLTADLGSQRQVRSLAASIGTLIGDGALDVLVNNAGSVSAWYTATEDGYETTFAVNHLAPFLLTTELLPLLRRSEHARIITTSSGSHYRTRVRWRDVMYRTRYGCLAAYKQSKLANVLFTKELNRRLGLSSGIRAYAVDPGLVNTSIGEKRTGGIVKWFWGLRRRGGISPAEGAATIVFLATSQDIEDPEAVYWKECRPQRPSRYAEREEITRRFWELSERLCGQSGVAPRATDRCLGKTTEGVREALSA